MSNILNRYTQTPSIIDVEPVFKTGPAPKPELITALRKDILSSITILSATVPEVKTLLDEAGIPTDYPKNIGDVVEMAKALRDLGPKYVLIKREVFEEAGLTTTFHFVLCGDKEPLIVNSQFENPKSITGASYSIPGKYANKIIRFTNQNLLLHSNDCSKFGKGSRGTSCSICCFQVHRRNDQGRASVFKSLIIGQLTPTTPNYYTSLYITHKRINRVFLTFPRIKDLEVLDSLT